MIESVAPTATVRTDLGLLAWIRRNAHVCIAGAIYAGAILVASAQEFVQDTWLSIAGGRDIARHGGGVLCPRNAIGSGNRIRE